MMRLLLLVVLTGILISVVMAESPNCNIPLQTGSSRSSRSQQFCLEDCLGQNSLQTDSFVCDISAQWMHHVGGVDNDWYPATPPKGTGIHEYVAFSGTPPCLKNGYCPGCAASSLAVDKTVTNLCAVQIDPEDCTVQCHDAVDTAEDEGSASTIILLCFMAVLSAVGYVVYQKKMSTNNPYRAVQLVQMQ